MSDDLIGKQLDEYRLEDLLGQGGMARVYRALDVRLERWVAIKVIDASFRTDSDYMVRFEREAKAIAQLEHPHIVSLYRYGEVDGLLYMAMRYIEGSALNKLLATYRDEGELIPIAEAHRVIHQVCQALDYAHSKGVIHRDVKPANIMLDKQGNTFLADFGLALVAEVGTRGEIFGTPHYIAPEQAMSSAGAVPQSDLYAVGVMLYEMFTGELPFQAESALDVAMLHMSEPPPSPREIEPGISPELEAVILKALDKEPEDRYPSGDELVKALDQALKANSQVSLPLPPADMSIPQRVAVDLAKRPLPPPPAGMLPMSSPQSQVAAGQIESAPTPAASSRDTRPFIYAGVGLGILFIVGTVLFLISGAAAFFFLRGNGGSDNELAGINETPPTEVIPVVNAEEAAVEAEIDASETENASTVETEIKIIPTEVDTAVTESTSEPTQPAAAIEAAAEEESPLEEPTDEPAPIVTEAPLPYTLLLLKLKGDSLFIMNMTDRPFPLDFLHFSGGDRSLTGEVWSIELLESGDCVSIWKNKGKPKAPNVSCKEVGQYSVDNKNRFWEHNYDVYYAGEWLASCPENQERCPVSIPAELVSK